MTTPRKPRRSKLQRDYDRLLDKSLFLGNRLAEVMTTLQLLMEDLVRDEKCFANCKNRYFCRLPRGHRGPHAEGQLHWPR